VPSIAPSASVTAHQPAQAQAALPGPAPTAASHAPAQAAPASLGQTASNPTPTPTAPSSNPPWANQPRAAGGVVSGQGTFIDPPEGTALADAVLATFTDSYEFSQSSDFYAPINWNDGTPTSLGYVDPNPGGPGYEVKGNHLYMEEGAYHPVISVKDVVSGQTTPITASIVVDEAPMVLTGVNVDTVAGQDNTYIVADYGPAEPLDPPTVSVFWGDGTPTTTGTVSQTSILGQHAYAMPGTYTIQITSTESDGTTATTTATANVVALPITGIGVPVSGTEAQQFTQPVADLYIPAGYDLDSVQASITWGDGSQASAGWLADDGHGGWYVEGTHTYAEEGADDVTITITAPGNALTLSGTAVVVGAPLTGSVALSAQPTETVEFDGNVATFHDADTAGSAGDYAAIVDWGNGRLSAGTVSAGANPGDWVVSGSTTYMEEGTYPLTVTVEDEGASKLVLTGSASVVDAPLVVDAGSSWSARGSYTWGGLFGTFTEGAVDASGEFSATISWGDGSTSAAAIYGQTDAVNPSGFVAGQNVQGNSSGNFALFGSHTYTHTGTFTLTLTVTDSDGASASGTDSIQITQGINGNPPSLPTNPYLTLTAAGNQTIQEGQSVSGTLATLSDADPGTQSTISDLGAAVDWGDLATPGQQSAGLVSAGAGTWDVQLGHVYAFAGTYHVTLYANDADDHQANGNGYSSVVASFTVTVTEAPITDLTLIPQASPLQATEGQAIAAGTVLATFSTAAPGSSGDYQATVSWGDDSPVEAGTVSVSGGVVQVTAAAAHTYSEDGGYLLQVSLAGPASSASANTTVVVGDAAVTAQTTGPWTAPLQATQGVHLSNVALVNVTDAYAADGPGAFTAVVNWGDGSPDETDGLTGSGGVYQVVGSHTYVHPGAFTARVVLRDDAKVRAVEYTNFNVAPATPPAPGAIWLLGLRGGGMPPYQLEGVQTGDELAELYDPTPHRDADCYTVTLTWGDGVTSSGDVGPMDGHPGYWWVNGQHVYRDTGVYLVSATVSACGVVLGTSWSTLTVCDRPFTLQPTTPQTAAVTGQSLGMSNVGLQNVVLASGLTMLDTDPGEYSAVIDWGDNTAPTVGQVAVVHYQGDSSPIYVTGSHAYTLPGTYVALVYIEDSGGATDLVQTTITVTPAAEGVPASIDAGTMYDADWREWPRQTTTSFGDGSASSIDYPWSGLTWASWGPWYHWWAGWSANADKMGIYHFTAEHAFTEEGNVTVGTSSPMVLDDTGSTAVPTGVADAGLRVIGSVGSVYTYINLVDGGPASFVLATFSDDNPRALAGDFTVSADGGPTGSSVTVQANADGTFSLVANNPRSWFGVGTHYILFTIKDAGSASTSFTTVVHSMVSIGLSPMPLPAATVGLDTGPLFLDGLVEFNYLDYNEDTAVISWGDGTTSTPSQNQIPFVKLNHHVYQSPGTKLIKVSVDDWGGGHIVFYTSINVFPGSAELDQLHNDPTQGLLLPVGQAQVSPNTGELQTTQALDFDQSPGTAVGRAPALVYNSSTVNGWPVLQLRIHSDASAPVPDKIELYFGGAATDWVLWGAPDAPLTFTTTGHQPGDDYVLEIPTWAYPNEVALTSQQTGRYEWPVDVKMYYGTGPDATVGQFQMDAWTVQVDNQQSPYGAGWGISGVDHLVDDCCHGVIWVSGNGDWRWFAQNPDGSYTNPPEDFGTLVENADGSWKYTAKDGTVTNFDFNGDQTSVVDTHGLATTYRYNGNGALTEVDSIDGGVTTFAYGSGGVTITEPGNRVWTLTLSGGDLTQITDPTGATRTLAYSTHHLTHDSWAPLSTTYAYNNDNGVLDSVDQGAGSVWVVNPVALVGVSGNAPHIADAAGTLTTPLGYPDRWTLTAAGEPLTHLRADQREESWQRDAHEQVTTYTDFLGLSTGYTYDNSASGKGDLLEVDYPDGGVVHYAYEQTFHHVTQTTDQDSNVTDNTYDPATGDLLSTTVAAGTSVAATTLYHWSNGLLTEMIDPVHDTISYTYDAHRRQLTEEHFNPDGTLVSDSTLGYDPAGNVQTQTDGDGFITTFGTDRVNQLTETIDADGNTTSQAYDASGLLTESIDGRGVVSANAYDQRGLLTSSTEDAGGTDPRTTTFGNDLDGRQTLSTSPLAEATRNYYDVDGRGVAVTDPLGYTSDTLYDDDSRVTESADNDANISRSTYDLMGRLLGRGVYDPDGATLVSSEGYLYDLAGNVTEKVDGDGYHTDYGLDAQERVTRTTEGANSSDPTTTGTLYDLAAHVTGSVDGLGATTGYLVDGDGQTTETIDPLGIRTYSLFDHAGRVTETMDGNQKPSFTYYDPAGQVTETVDAQGITQLQGYDAAGEVTATTDGKGNPSYAYFDSHGEVTEQIDAMSIPSFSWFDKDGQVTKTVDGDGHPATTLYDADGRATEAIDGRNIATYQYYDGDGNVTEAVDGNSHPSYSFFDAAGQVTEAVDGRGIPTFSYFDHNGQLTESIDGNGKPSWTYYDAHGQATENIDALNIKTYSYFDADGQVTEAVDGIGNPSYTYFDADGRASAQVDALGITTTSLFDHDGRVTETVDGNTNPSWTLYDNDGRATEQIDALNIPTFNYFDNDGQVTKTVDGDGYTATTLYDKDGRVTEQIDAMTIPTYTYYDHDGLLTETVDGNNYSSFTYYDADGQVTEQVDGAQHTTLDFRDGDGQVTKTVDGNNNPSYTLYDADGEATEHIDALGITTTSLFDHDGRVTEMVDGNHYLSYTLYDADGQATEQIDNLGIPTYSFFDKDGQVTKTVDGNNNPSYTYYDADGQVTEQVDALNHKTYSYYDHDGQVTKTVDGDGYTATTLYDADGRATEQIDALGIPTYSSFDNDGNVTKTVDGDGYTATTLYDADGRATEHIDALNIPTLTYFDNDGQVTRTVDGDNYTFTTLYDGDGQVTEQIDGRHIPTLKFYDGDGQVTKTVDGNYNPSYTLYDADGRVTELIDALGIKTYSVFDNDGNVTESIDGRGYTATTLYDKDGRATEVIDALGIKTYSVFDKDGQVTESIDGRGNTSTTLYDADGRATEHIDNLGTPTYDLYDKDGQLTESIDGDGNASTTLYDADGQVTEQIDALGIKTYSVFDHDGNITETIDGRGYTTTTLYDADGRATEHIDALNIPTFSYFDDDGQATTTVDGNGYTATTLYDGDGNVTEQIDALNHKTYSVFDNDGNVTLSIDGLNHTATTLYDADSRATEVIDALGIKTYSVFDNDGNVTESIDGKGYTSTTLYDKDGRATEQIDNLGTPTYDVFDNDGNITESIDGKGHTATTLFDADGQATEQIDNLGTATYDLYDHAGQVTESIDGNGKPSYTYFDADGQVTQTVDARGFSSYTYYDKDGQVTETVDADNHAETTLYDADGRATEHIDALGNPTYDYFDHDGQVTKSVDADGNVALTYYDADGQVTETVDVARQLDAFTYYDADGQVTETIDGAGHATSTLYDADGRVTETIDGDGHASSTLYDADGNVTETVDGKNAATLEYPDAGGRVTEQVDALGYTQLSSFDADGQLTKSIDADGYTALTEYDADGRVTGTVDGTGQLTQQLYDGAGNLTAVIDPDGNTTQYRLDADGNRTVLVDPLGHTATSLYDGDGILTEAFDRDGRTLLYQHDNDGRLTGERWYDASGTQVNSLGFVYDPDSNLTSASNNAGTETFSYQDNLLTQQIDSSGVTLGYLHDGDGNVTGIVDSQGATAGYLLDGDGLLTEQTWQGSNQQLRIDLGHDADGNLQSITRYADTAGTQQVGSATYGYQVDRLTALAQYDGSGNVLASYGYLYDGNGWLTQAVDNGTTTGYGYDARGELTQAGTQTFGFDHNGNPNSGGAVPTLGNELVTDGTWTYGYDPEGNVISRANNVAGLGWVFSYDTANELTGAVERDSNGTILVQASYAYDAFGNRIDSTVTLNGTTTTTQSVYIAVGMPDAAADLTNWRLWSDSSSGGVGQSWYVGGQQPDQWLARVDIGLGVRGLLTDRLGSPRVVTDAAGAAIDRISYGPWGSITTETAPGIGGRVGLQGGLLERATGQIQFGPRDYSPEMRRWFEEDPSGLGPDSNPYRRMGNALTNATDPSGLSAQPLNSEESALFNAGYKKLSPTEQRSFDKLVQQASNDPGARKSVDFVKWQVQRAVSGETTYDPAGIAVEMRIAIVAHDPKMQAEVERRAKQQQEVDDIAKATGRPAPTDPQLARARWERQALDSQKERDRNAEALRKAGEALEQEEKNRLAYMDQLLRERTALAKARLKEKVLWVVPAPSLRRAAREEEIDLLRTALPKPVCYRRTPSLA
jgi:RHS repeat-associated protein